MKKIMYLLSIVLMVTMLGCGSPTTEPTKEPVTPPSTNVTPTPTPTPAPAPAPAPKNKPTITKAEFDQIQNGMTYEQVTQIVGGPGEMTVETGSPGDQFYTVAYQYEGEGSLGANAQLMFQSGKLNTKAQFGLK